jgi:hypothetical protein
MMMKEIIFIFILSIKLFQSIKVTDFCYQISIEKEVIKCKENKKYSYQCFEGLCSINRYSCQSIKLFSTVKDIQRIEMSYHFFKNQYESFLNKIKDCTKPSKYKWNSNDVCLNTKDCLQTTFWRIWSTLLKPGECRCKEKYNYKCNSDYCASDKRACSYLKKNLKAKIKNC